MIGQMQTSSHQLEIEGGRYAHIPQKREFGNCIIKEWNMQKTMFVIIIFFRKKEGDTIASLAMLWPIMQSNGI